LERHCGKGKFSAIKVGESAEKEIIMPAH